MGKYLVFTGGVGGAKLCLGLSQILEPEDILFVVNTGDDFEHLGLKVCPDLDTLMYTLSRESDEERGWGRKEETWRCLNSLRELGGPSWFNLGDKDLAVHLYRTHLLKQNHKLSEITSSLYRAFGIRHNAIPMSDDLVATTIVTAGGEELSFQDYFVKESCVPVVKSIQYKNATAAKMPKKLKEILFSSELKGIIFAPSNPFLSIEPILRVAETRLAIQKVNVPKIAISPIVNGASVKGPTDKIMAELGMGINNFSIIQQYKNLLTHLIIDQTDGSCASEIENLGLNVCIHNTLMKNLSDKIRLAEMTLMALSEAQ